MEGARRALLQGHNAPTGLKPGQNPDGTWSSNPADFFDMPSPPPPHPSPPPPHQPIFPPIGPKISNTVSGGLNGAYDNGGKSNPYEDGSYPFSDSDASAAISKGESVLQVAGTLLLVAALIGCIMAVVAMVRSARQRRNSVLMEYEESAALIQRSEQSSPRIKYGAVDGYNGVSQA